MLCVTYSVTKGLGLLGVDYRNVSVGNTNLVSEDYGTIKKCYRLMEKFTRQTVQKCELFFESSYEKVNNIVVWIVEPARSLLTWPAFHTIPRFCIENMIEPVW